MTNIALNCSNLAVVKLTQKLGTADPQYFDLLRIHAVSATGAGGHAVWDPRDNHLTEATGDAWRWLAWVRPGPDGWPERLPLETFGPLPEPRRLR